MPVIKITLGIGHSGATRKGLLKIPQDEWDACETTDDQNQLMRDYASEWANKRIELEWELRAGETHD